MSTVSNINCPQKIIKFYEERVRFRNEASTEDVIAALETDSAEPVDIPQDILQQY
jgi:Chromo shadow domain